MDSSEHELQLSYRVCGGVSHKKLGILDIFCRRLNFLDRPATKDSLKQHRVLWSWQKIFNYSESLESEQHFFISTCVITYNFFIFWFKYQSLKRFVTTTKKRKNSRKDNKINVFGKNFFSAV